MITVAGKRHPSHRSVLSKALQEFARVSAPSVVSETLRKDEASILVRPHIRTRFLTQVGL